MKTQQINQTIGRALKAGGRFIIRHRHDIADALMITAAFLKFWPVTEYLPLPASKAKKRKS